MISFIPVTKPVMPSNIVLNKPAKEKLSNSSAKFSNPSLPAMKDTPFFNKSNGILINALKAPFTNPPNPAINLSPIVPSVFVKSLIACVIPLKRPITTCNGINNLLPINAKPRKKLPIVPKNFDKTPPPFATLLTIPKTLRIVLFKSANAFIINLKGLRSVLKKLPILPKNPNFVNCPTEFLATFKLLKPALNCFVILAKVLLIALKNLPTSGFNRLNFPTNAFDKFRIPASALSSLNNLPIAPVTNAI